MHRFSCVLLLSLMTGALSGCGGGGGGGSTQNPPVAVSNGSGTLQSVSLQPQSTSFALAAVAGLSTTMVFPAVARPTAVDLNVSQTAPANAAIQSVRHTRDNFSFDIYEYITLSPHATVSLPTLPALSFTFPSTVALDGKSVFFGITDPVAQPDTLAAFQTEGPAKVSTGKATIGAVARPLVLQAGHHYTFMVYGLSVPSSVTAPTIFIGDSIDYNGGAGPPADILTFHASGTPDLPPIKFSINSDPTAMVVAPNGTKYVLDLYDDTIKSYAPNGARAALTIQLPMSPGPDAELLYRALSVGPDGTIDVSTIECFGSCVGYILRFAPDGTALARIDVPGFPVAQAVDATGNILIVDDPAGNYVTGTSVIRVTPNGSAHTTLVSGLRFAKALAVDTGGRIYVVDDQTIRSFDADGSPRTLAIAPNFAPGAIAVDATGKIYILDPADEQLVSYNADGSSAAPTINTGYSPFAVVVH